LGRCRRGDGLDEGIACVRVKKPEALSFPEAASLPSAGVTAWQVLDTRPALL
jgi:NADPH:quinone reductase-like Zn-dependent oxidoreductase